jgi:hypothetical protein
MIKALIYFRNFDRKLKLIFEVGSTCSFAVPPCFVRIPNVQQLNLQQSQVGIGDLLAGVKAHIKKDIQYESN